MTNPASPREEQLIAENSQDLIVRISSAGTLNFASAASHAILGKSPDALVGTEFYALVHPEDVAALRQAQASPSKILPVWRCRRADGEWGWFESSTAPLPGGDLLIISRDVTERRQAEQRSLLTQKMDAIGRLGGAVAHDVNNLLSIITSAAMLLNEELGPEHASLPLAEEISIACRRGVDFTRQLLSFSRRQQLVAAPVSLNELVKTVVEQLRPAMPKSIEVVTALQPELAMVNIDAMQVQQALSQLALNARDAMATGGALAFRTANLTVGPDLDAPPGEYAMVRVEDTGTGMDAATQSRLFEPFFTTKPRGKGVGLGLAISYGMVRQSGGVIRVRSAPGEGSSFTLLFPRYEGVPKPAATVPEAPARVVAATETILLVEDDAAVRRVAAALLEKKGYRVLQAEGGTQALEVSAQGKVHLLLTDVMMPGMSGPEVASALKSKWPALRVLFMSGTANDPNLKNFIHKPFSLENLSKRVREVLDQPA
jgi:two-component system cell cycle sensor histidine kinase/response regulator CckA